MRFPSHCKFTFCKTLCNTKLRAIIPLIPDELQDLVIHPQHSIYKDQLLNCGKKTFVVEATSIGNNGSLWRGEAFSVLDETIDSCGDGRNL